VNNVLTVLNVLLKTAVEWGVIERLPCTIRLLPTPKTTAQFHDFDAYERLVTAGADLDWRTHLLVLLGGEAGLRCGEMMALEWGDVDKRQLRIERSDWKGQVTSTKGGRVRFVPMTRRLGGRPHATPSPSRAACAGAEERGSPYTEDGARPSAAGRTAGQRAGRSPYPPTHVLLAPGDAWSSGAGHSGAGRAPGLDHDAAVYAPESRGDRGRDSPAGSVSDPTGVWRHAGDGEE